MSQPEKLDWPVCSTAWASRESEAGTLAGLSHLPTLPELVVLA